MEEKNSIPAWSLLPRKLLVNVTLSSSSRNFPGTENIILEMLSSWVVKGEHAAVQQAPSTSLGVLVNGEIECEKVFRKTFFFWQTLQ